MVWLRFKYGLTMAIFTSGGETSKTSPVPWEHFSSGRTSSLHFDGGFRFPASPSFGSKLTLSSLRSIVGWLAWLLVGWLTGWLGWPGLGWAWLCWAGPGWRATCWLAGCVAGMAGLNGLAVKYWTVVSGCLEFVLASLRCAIASWPSRIPRAPTPRPRALPPKNPEGAQGHVMIEACYLHSWAQNITYFWINVGCGLMLSGCVAFSDLASEEEGVTLPKLHPAYRWSEFEEKGYWWVRTVITPNKEIM